MMVVQSDAAAEEAKAARDAAKARGEPPPPPPGSPGKHGPPPGEDRRGKSHHNVLLAETAAPAAEPTLRKAARVGVWANLATTTQRGPFKQLSFHGIDLHVDLPKTLGTQRLGARAFILPAAHVAARAG